MMNKKFPLVIGSLVATGALLWCVADWYAGGPTWPRIRRHDINSVSDWLTGLDPGHGSSNAQSARAIKEMGTNALPGLTSVVTSRDSLLRTAAVALLGWQKAARLGLSSRDGLRTRAVIGIWMLGDDASPAVTILVKAVRRGGEVSFAVEALTGIGPTGICSLSEFATNQDLQVRLAVAQALAFYPERVRFRSIESQQDPAHFAAVARLAVPLLARLTQDRQSSVRALAAQGLGYFSSQVATGLRALTALLKDHDPEVRAKAVSSLGSLRDQAKAAVPELLRYIQETQEKGERTMAVVALWRIDAEAVAQAGYSVQEVH